MSKTIEFFLNGQKYYIQNKITIFDLISYFDYNTSLLVLEHNNLICIKENWDKIYTLFI